jgi:hypothetical protein
MAHQHIGRIVSQIKSYWNIFSLGDAIPNDRVHQQPGESTCCSTALLGAMMHVKAAS